jgi:multidrug efflux system membrane fusion protein
MGSYSRPRAVWILVAAGALAAVIVATHVSARTTLTGRGRGEARVADRGTTTNGSAAPLALPVAAAKAERADMPVRLNALGSVAAFNTVTVRTRVDGQLMRVPFREGQFVKQGDLLAEIDPRPFQVQLAQAQGQLAKDQAQLAAARVDLERYDTLLSQDSIARQTVDAQRSTVTQLEAALKVDQAAIDSAKLNLTYSRVTAPLSGRAGLRLVDPGNVVSASSTPGLVVITQVEPIAVLFTLPEDALRIVLPRVRDGARLPVEAFDRNGAARLAAGLVVTVDNQIDQSTGTVRVKAVFDNRDHALFPAQFVNVRLLADTKPAQLVVPASAVQQGPQGPFVFVVRDGKAAVRRVAVAVVDGEQVSIEHGLDQGELVVTDGVDRLRQGSAVEVRQ